MPTIKSRINITMSEEVRDALEKLARRDRIPQATKAARMLEVALELEEDHVWDKIAAQRDAKSTRYLSHAKAWKR